MKKTATVLAVVLAMMATSFAQGPRQEGDHRPPPPPPPQEEKAKPEEAKDKEAKKAEREAARKERRKAKEEARKRQHTIVPPKPPHKPVIVPSQRFVVPKYS